MRWVCMCKEGKPRLHLCSRHVPLPLVPPVLVNVVAKDGVRLRKIGNIGQRVVRNEVSYKLPVLVPAVQGY